jgi:hypothetical protein
MPSAADQQLTLNFEPSLPEKYRTLRDFMAYRVQVQSKPAKTIAGDMDMSPSMLSRKLTPGDGDTQRFNVDDLENYISVTKDTSAIEYLASKYLQSDSSRQARAIARVEALATEMGNALAALKRGEA